MNLSDTPRTETIIRKRGEIRDHALYELARELERENARLRDALQRIANRTDSPAIDAEGQIQFGLHCGVEDRACADRYEGADYGYASGVNRALEWAQNEAEAASANAKAEPRGQQKDNL
jgi:hypothetical protein